MSSVLKVLVYWFLLLLLALVQGRSVGEGGWEEDLDVWQESVAPQPDPTMFAYNQTDKTYNFYDAN